MAIRVLVVDEEPDAEPLFRQHFRKEVREWQYRPNFALCDINMPGMSGLDLMPKAKERRLDLPVFIIAAYGDADTVATGLKRGTTEILTKPVDAPG